MTNQKQELDSLERKAAREQWERLAREQREEEARHERDWSMLMQLQKEIQELTEIANAKWDDLESAMHIVEDDHKNLKAALAEVDDLQKQLDRIKAAR